MNWRPTGFASAACVLTFGVFVGRSSDGASKSDALPLRGCIPNGASTKRRTSKKSRVPPLAPPAALVADAMAGMNGGPHTDKDRGSRAPPKPPTRR